MENIFLRIVNISVVSCYTIAVVFVMRAFLLKWERKYAYLLWFVVFINLCIPFRVSGPFSLVPSWVAEFDISKGRPGTAYETKQDYLPNEEITVSVVSWDKSKTGVIHHEESVHHYDTPEMDAGVPGTDTNSETIYEAAGEAKQDYLPNEEITVSIVSWDESKTDVIHHEESVHHYNTPGTDAGVPGTDTNSETVYNITTGGRNIRNRILASVWFLGVVLIAAWNVYSFLKLRKSLENALPSATGDTDIKVVEKIASPFLWGFFSTVIYLPGNIEEDERTYIIAHERYHRKRKDYIVKPVVFVIALVHWFNPLVWASYVLFVRDMEISCDEAVIAGADGDIRKKYAASLLKYAARQNGYTLTPITFGEPSLKSRIKNVLHYKKRNTIISTVILSAVLVLMLGLLFAPEKETLAAVDEPQWTQNPENTAVDAPAGVQPDTGVAGELDGEIKHKKALFDSGRVSGRHPRLAHRRKTGILFRKIGKITVNS